MRHPPSLFDARPNPVSTVIAESVGLVGIDRMLHTVRKHLGMDVAFISRFRAQDRLFDHADADNPASPVQRGGSLSLQEGYCLKVVRGELPQCIPDTSALPAAQAIPATAAIPIGAHLSVPIVLSTGVVHGTLCCFRHQPDPSLGERDMQLMRAFADVIADRIDEQHAAQRVQRETVARIRHAMDSGAPRIVYQPIYALRPQRLEGFECLSTFDLEPRRPPNVWFDAAAGAGLGTELELHALHKALEMLPAFAPHLSLSINCSPAAVLDGSLARTLEFADLSRIVVEITEHATVDNYTTLAATLQPLRDRGARLAIDDAGAGYASMRHILNLQPDVIKLDMSITRGIDTDASRRALARGLILFAHDIGSGITAEGVETEDEARTLGDLGVDHLQGYLLGRPMPFDDARRCAMH